MCKMIEKGYLGDNPFYVRRLNADDLEIIKEVQQKVFETLPNKDMLQPLTTEEFQLIFNGNGVMIGAFVDERLIAFRALLIPEKDEEGLGADIGLTDEEDLNRILYLEITNVLPQYRGYGLQKRLGNMIMKEIDVTRFDYLISTVMPYNIPSLKDKFYHGMHIERLKEKYGGKLRYIFVKYLNKKVALEGDSVYISMGDIEKQQKFLNSGYIGISIIEKEDDWFVEYRKVKDSQA